MKKIGISLELLTQKLDEDKLGVEIEKRLGSEEGFKVRIDRNGKNKYTFINNKGNFKRPCRNICCIYRERNFLCRGN